MSRLPPERVVIFDNAIAGSASPSLPVERKASLQVVVVVALAVALAVAVGGPSSRGYY